MSNRDLIVSSSPYEVQEKFLNVARKHLEIDEMNILKAGLFGYITEVMAQSVSDAAFHRDSMYDEFFPNTMSRPESIYNLARTYNKEIGNAVPSRMVINFAIRKQDVIDHLKPGPGDTMQFIINKDNVFYVSNFPFMLQRSVRIVATEITKPDGTVDYAITAQYEDDGVRSSRIAGTSDSPYINTWVESVAGTPYIFLILDIYQMEKQVNTFKVFNDDINDRITFNVRHKNQLARFQAYYKHQGKIYPLNAYFNSNILPQYDEFYCFYNPMGEDEFQIFFSALPGSFRPKFNSEIIVETYTTRGSQGNFTFKGDVLFKFKEDELSRIYPVITPATDASGGRDRPSLKEIKREIIENILVRDNLITETDLNLFFNGIISDVSINRSSLRFIRRRDDILSRIFSAFLLMKDRHGLIVPTNTINFQMDLEDLEKRNNRLQAGEVIIYDAILGTYRPLREDEFPEEYMDSDDIIMYSIPYLIEFREHPFPRITYHRNSISREFPVSFKQVNPSIVNEFVVNGVSIERNSILEDSYKFAINLITNVDETEIDGIVPRLLFRKGETVFGYIDMELTNEEEMEYTAFLETDDTFDELGNFSIINSLRSLETGEILSRVHMEEGVTVQLGILFNRANDKTKYEDFEKMIDIDNYAVAVLYQLDDTVNLMRSMDNVMTSTIAINENGIATFKSVPVIATSYFNTLDNYQEIYRILENYERVLVDNFDKLENNTTIDMKFYNTYGISKHYSIDTTHLRLSFRVKLKGSVGVPTVDPKIKAAIMRFFEQRNEEAESHQRVFAISNLIRSLEEQFDEISFVEFKGVNGTDAQRIEYILPEFRNMTSEQLIDYVPEYINVDVDRRGSSKEGAFAPRIDIEYI